MRDRFPPARAGVLAVVVTAWALALPAAFALPGALRPLVVAPAVLLAPGFAAWRALAPRRSPLPHRDLVGSLVLGLVVHAVALAVTFALGRSIVLAIGLEVGLSLVLALVAARGVPTPAEPADQEEHPDPGPGWGWFGAAAGLSGLLGLAVQRTTLIEVDAPFHLGRVRKLAELGHLSPGRMAELVDGSNHPGYAFPLWHEVIAATARISRLDAGVAYAQVGAPFAILAGLATYALVVELARRHDVALAATTIVAGIAIATDFGQTAPWTQKASWSLLADPPSAVTQILLPALLVCLVLYAVEPGWDTAALVASASGGVSIVHPTYLPLALVPIAGAVLVEALHARRVTWRPLGAGAVALLAPFALSTAWVLPLARDTTSRTGDARAQADAVELYGGRLGQIHEWHGLILLDPRFLLLKSHVALAAMVAVIAIALVPGRRARWLLGAVAALVVVALVPPFFDVLQRALTISQARRIGLFLPAAPILAVAALGLVRRLRPRLLIPAALGLGVVVALIPGTSPIVVAVATAATVLLLGAGILIAIRRSEASASADAGRLRAAPLVALCLAGPAVLAGVPAFVGHVRDPGAPAFSLTPELVHRLRALPSGTVIAGDLSASYLVPAYTLDTIVAAPPKNVANTSRNDPYRRADDMQTVLRAVTPDATRRTILARYHAEYLLLDRRRERPVDQVLRRTPGYRVVYREPQPTDREASYFVLYRLRF